MQLTIEDIKATLVRLQGQFDVWQNLYATALKEAEDAKAKEVSNAEIKESK